MINLENEDYDDDVGQRVAGALSQQDVASPKGKLLTQYYGIGHASLDNYIAEISGQAPNPETQGDCVKYVEFVVDRNRAVRPGARARAACTRRR